MSKTVNRRHFIKGSLKAGASISLAATFMQLSACSLGGPRPNLKLVKDPNGICDLPEGFSYTVISKRDDMMTDGLPVPGYHDGMACFEGPDGAIILVRNHETPTYFPTDPPSPMPALAYDPDASGGTTTIWLNDKLEVTKHHLSLTGTIRNCAGGKTPWNTWISSEEAGYDGWMMGNRHGYNFEVNPLDPLKRIEPLKAMGRFNHEAVAIDPETGIAYQTEDNTSGCFYRFLPNTPGRLADGGTLEALKFKDGAIRHTSDQPLEKGRKYACDWVPIDDPDPEENTVAREAKGKGAAVFVRGEGCVAHEGSIYFTCTTGGKDGVGQIFRYIPNDDGGAIELVFESTDGGMLEKPDNITVNPWGDLIVCEDNSLNTLCLVGIRPDGKAYYIAATGLSEWAGACFSPDGQTLFANIQRDPGLTVGIRGPWERLRASV